jgi:hypothetical protein
VSDSQVTDDINKIAVFMGSPLKKDP